MFWSNKVNLQFSCWRTHTEAWMFSYRCKPFTWNQIRLVELSTHRRV